MKPLPAHIGVGLTSSSKEDLPYNYKQDGIYHNYFFTKDNYHWPESIKIGEKVIDGFSPNLNKQLHIGHLKNLAVASAISNICCKKSVAMLGASLGILDSALEDYKKWCNLANYNPEIHFDIDLPKTSAALQDGTGKYLGCKLYNNIVVYKSDGKPTYAAHDLAFSELVKPDIYLTGAEQKDHFKSLGLGDKHLSLGLVLGPDGKKMSSSSGETVSAKDVLNNILDNLKETEEPTKLAWNILAWQFNSSSVSSNTNFNVDKWVKPENPGLYITYTYAKLQKALKGCVGNAKNVDENHLPILGLSSYFTYYWNKAVQESEPCNLANYALLLAKKLSNIYEFEQIQGGNTGLIYALNYAVEKLGKSMKALSMYCLEKV